MLLSLAAKAYRLALLLLAPPDANRRGASYAVTVITPIAPGQLDPLRDLLHSFAPGDGSPLARVPDVQFARWVVIDQLRTGWDGAPRRPSSLNSSYLLFSADLTAPANRADDLPESFFRDLAERIPRQCAAVWGKCRGFPGTADVEQFVDYLTRSQIRLGLYYAAFPDDTPDEIAAALEVRRKFAEFVVAHQYVISSPAAANGPHEAFKKLRDEYVRESAEWGS